MPANTDEIQTSETPAVCILSMCGCWYFVCVWVVWERAWRLHCNASTSRNIPLQTLARHSKPYLAITDDLLAWQQATSQNLIDV